MKKILLTLAFVLSALIGFAQNSFDRWVPTSGTDTYTTNITSFPGSYNNTQPYVKFGNGNTGNSTISINGMVAVPIRIWDGDSWELVVAGDIPDQSNAILSYDNNNGYYKAIIFENIGSGSGGGVWGTITGTLSNQTDLQSALDAKQAADSDLTTIAGLTPSNDDFLQRKAGAWANRTPAQVKTDLNLAGSNTGDQTSIVGITGTLSEYNTSLTGADFATGGGTISGSSSGVNTGDQTITLTGDVTGSGTGSFATTLATVPVAKGGTGLTSIGSSLQQIRVNSGATALEYFSTSTDPGTTIGSLLQLATVATPNVYSELLSVATGNVLISGGVGALNSWGKVTPSHISGTWPIGNGGTGLTALGTANQLWGVNSGASALEYKSNVGLTSAGDFSQTGTITTSALNSFSNTRTYSFSTGTNVNALFYTKPVFQYTGGTSTLYGFFGDAPTTTNTTGLTYYSGIFMGGNFGIGSLIPTARLQVVSGGTGSGVAFRVQNSTPGTLMFIQDDGVASYVSPNGRTTAFDNFTVGSGTFTPSSGTAAHRTGIFSAVYGQTGTATGDLTEVTITSTHSSVLTSALGGTYIGLKFSTIGAWSQSSGSKSFTFIDADQTYNQTTTASGAIYGFGRYRPTETAILGPHYFLVNESVTARTGLGVAAPTSTLHLKASTTAANTSSLKLNEGSRQTAAEDGTINYVSNNLEFVETSTVYTLAKTLTATATLDFADTAAGTATDLTITVTGAADGDAVSVGVPNGSTVANGSFTAWVSATNTVTVRFANSNLVTALNPASGTFRVSVIKY